MTKVNLCDGREGYRGVPSAFHTLLGEPEGSGPASTPQEAANYACQNSEMDDSSNMEKLSLPSFFSLGHQDPSHQVTLDSSIYSSHHHHHGLQQHCLDTPALPMFLASNPHEPPPPPPPPGDGTPSPASTVLYDPPWTVQMDLCNQSHVVGSALQWLPNEYGFVPVTAGVASSACDGWGVEGWMGQSASAVLGFGGGAAGLRRREVRGSNSTEKHRRGKMSEKFGVLRSLIPNPGTKHDKASILAEATDYIKELMRTIDELRALVEAKQRRTDRSTKLSASDETGMENSPAQHSGADPTAAGRPSKALLMRCSWLKRNYKDTFVDVRIVEDDVTINLVRRRKVKCCLLLVAGTLHELQLELLHLASGNVGDSLVLMINSKIEGGSSVYASAIAKKLVEALEGTPPASVSSF